LPKQLNVKINNETKIGILGIVSISLLILGFQFLKGNKLFSKSMTLYAEYGDIRGLTSSNPIVINGMQVGVVNKIENDQDMRKLLVTFSIHKDIRIPANSIAHISPNPLTITKIEIKLGDSKNYLSDQDTILTDFSDEFIANIINSKVDPLLGSVKNTVSSVDSILWQAQSVLDEDNRRNLALSMKNLQAISASILQVSSSLEKLMDSKNGAFGKSLAHVENITGNLNANQSKVNQTMQNLEQTSKQLADLDLGKTMQQLNQGLQQLQTSLAKLNNGEGSAGLLLSDPTLYKNLTATTNKVNVLLDDIRTHPGRYINVSVFGKKRKEKPLQTPLPDTLQAPYLQ
jgi:phospholipid/cholesterol/gamma-HCH transport system substrate-binding protein